MTHAERRMTGDRDSAVGPLAAGAAAGLIGGLVASWLMVRFQEQVWPPPEGSGESSTGKFARRAAALTGAEPLTDAQAEAGGALVHYALGAGLGLAYGAAAVVRPTIASSAGVPFGIATEVVIDQALVPALCLADPFWKCPVEVHARGLAAHLVFGIATDLTRRLCLGLAMLGGARANLLP